MDHTLRFFMLFSLTFSNICKAKTTAVFKHIWIFLMCYLLQQTVYRKEKKKKTQSRGKAEFTGLLNTYAKCKMNVIKICLQKRSVSHFQPGTTALYNFLCPHDSTVGSLWTFTALNCRVSLTDAVFKRPLSTAYLLTVVIISHPGCTEPCLTVKYSDTVACGDNYEAKIINVMLEVAFKRHSKQCFFSEAIGFENQSDVLIKKKVE